MGTANPDAVAGAAENFSIGPSVGTILRQTSSFVDDDVRRVPNKPLEHTSSIYTYGYRDTDSNCV